jgi:hypothetical protein
LAHFGQEAIREIYLFFGPGFGATVPNRLRRIITLRKIFFDRERFIRILIS